MNKTRGLLSFVALLTIIGQILILHSYLPNGWRFTLHIADGILLFSALIMLLFSFFRVGVTACGELCYNPDNWYWKTMAVFYPEYFYRGKVSLCKAFWLTVFAVFLVIGVLVLAVSLIVVLWDAYWKFSLLKIILGILIVVASIATIIGAIVGGKKVINKVDEAVNDKPRLRNAMGATGSVLGKLIVLSYLFFVIVGLPILSIMEKAKVSLYIAIIYYLIGVAGLVLTIEGAWLLIWSIFWYLPKVMRGTVLEQFLSTNKKQFCPTLTACDTKNRGLSFS